MTLSPLLRIEDLSVHYRVGDNVIRALNEVSLKIGKGEVLGVLGESGSGKTTLANAILKMVPPNAEVPSGKVFFDGRNLMDTPDHEMDEIRGKGISMIPQNALDALSPVHKVRYQLINVLRAHERISNEDALKRIKEKLTMAGLGEGILDRYFFELSGGMKERVLIAMSLLCNPKLVIADEPTTGLDVVLQRKILKEIKTLQRKIGFSMLFISHDVSVIAYESDKLAVLYGGKLLEYGDLLSVLRRPANPYTALLLQSYTDLRRPRGSLIEIKGYPPNPMNLPEGCVFHPRCPYATELCKKEEPPLINIGDGHLTRCYYSERVKEMWSS